MLKKRKRKRKPGKKYRIAGVEVSPLIIQREEGSQENELKLQDVGIEVLVQGKHSFQEGLSNTIADC